MTVYADIVFFANFISSSALFFLYGAIIKARPVTIRALAAAAVSGVYAIFETMLILPYILRVILLFCMVRIVFGRESILFNTLRLMLVIAGLELVFLFVMSQLGYDGLVANGTVTVLANGVLGFFIYALSYPLLLLLRYIADARSKIRHMTVTAQGRSCRLVLLYDSGNLLHHNGLPVAIVSRMSVPFVNTCECIEFGAVNGNGFLPVIKPESCVIDGIKRDIYIAVADRKFNGVDGIIGEV